MSNDRDDHEIHEFGDEFADDYRAARFEAAEDFPGPDGPSEFPGERARRHGPRRSHDHAHGPRGRRGQDNPWDAIFGPEGPFGPRGPLAKGGIFGPQGADVARTIWENATSGSSPWQPGPHRGRSPWEPQDARPQEAREWRTSDAPSQRGRDGERRHGRPGGPRGTQSDDGSARGRRGGPGGRRGGRRPRGDVRLAALLLIAEEPRNGYQVIEELAARTGGTWRPSSGAVYPALAQLEDEGLIEAFDTDGRKAYRLTAAGHDAVAAVQDAPAPWETARAEAREAFGGRSGGQLWQAFGQVAMAAKAVAATRDPATMTAASAVLEQARRALYRILADGPQDTPTGHESPAGHESDAQGTEAQGTEGQGTEGQHTDD